MISQPDGLMWATIVFFFLAGVVSLALGAAGYFVQKRPFLVPLLVVTVGVVDILFAVKYAQIVVPGFPGGPEPSASIRPFLFAISLVMLSVPFGFYITGDRELRIARKHAEELQAKRDVAQFAEEKLKDRLDAAYTQNAEQQQQFAQLKQLIITNVRHELQTPMSITLGYIDMIIHGTFGEVVGTKLHDPLTTVHKSTRRMSAVVERMVNTWREPAFRVTDMAVVGRQLLDDPDIWLNTRRNPADITISSDIPDHLFVIGDTEMLRTAVFELLNNALKFGSTEVHLTMFEEDGEVVTQVRDNGIGISRKYHRQVFEPLFQIRMDSKRPFEGAGMGLAVVESVAHAHDGHALVQQSRLGQGAIFNLIIPANQSGVSQS